jgi:cation transport regulator ChaC
MRDWDGRQDLWLFGYGSLIWNPGLPTVAAVRGKVHGYHRGLYWWSRVNRGTPEHPGLVLALDRGGSCAGIAFRIAGPTAQPHLETLWKREMPMGSYRPAWLPCSLETGERVQALAFVMRRDAPPTSGKLPDPVVKGVRQRGGPLRHDARLREPHRRRARERHPRSRAGSAALAMPVTLHAGPRRASAPPRRCIRTRMATMKPSTRSRCITALLIAASVAVSGCGIRLRRRRDQRRGRGRRCSAGMRTRRPPGRRDEMPPREARPARPGPRRPRPHPLPPGIFAAALPALSEIGWTRSRAAVPRAVESRPTRGPPGLAGRPVTRPRHALGVSFPTP